MISMQNSSIMTVIQWFKSPECVARPAAGDPCCLMVAFGRQDQCDPCGIWRISDARN